MNSIITGIGKALPQRVITNKELEEVVETSDQWIQERTGICTRHIATEETTVSLATEAARMALAKAEVSEKEVDMIVVATMTPDDFMPSTACRVQKNLKATRAFAFDVSAACSGFIYAISVADQFVRTGKVKKALVIGSEVLSKTIDWTDRTTCVIFADGAGAVLLEASPKEGIINTVLGSEGEDGEILGTPALGTTNYWCCSLPRATFMHMDGQTVFRFSTRIFGKSVEDVLRDTPYDAQDVDWFVPHQANVRIIDYAVRRLKVDRHRFYLDLDRCGNTSAASIPIALAEMQEEGLLKKGELLLCTGFGGGLTWGSVLIRFS